MNVTLNLTDLTDLLESAMWDGLSDFETLANRVLRDQAVVVYNASTGGFDITPVF